MNSFPNIIETESSLTVEFAPNSGEAKSQPLEIILDYNESGEVSGLEIINLAFEAGKNCLGLISALVPTEGDALKYSYDEDCDAFYLRLRLGTSLHQKSIRGTACLDPEGRIISLNAKWQGSL